MKNDLFNYPDGWEIMISSMDFLPEDNAVREGFLIAYLDYLGLLW